MEMISLEGKSNFFEKRVAEYRMAWIKPYNRDTAPFEAESLWDKACIHDLTLWILINRNLPSALQMPHSNPWQGYLPRHILVVVSLLEIGHLITRITKVWKHRYWKTADSRIQDQNERIRAPTPRPQTCPGCRRPCEHFRDIGWNNTQHREFRADE